MKDFLFELGTEELPVAAVRELSEALLERFRLALTQANIGFGKLKCFATPRRLAVFAQAVSPVQASQVISKRGPAVNDKSPADKPSPAVMGFAKSCGVDVADLQIQETEKGAWWVFTTETPELPTEHILPSIMQQILNDLPIKKLMRWGDGDLAFSRPVHWAVMLWGKEVLPATIFAVKTGRTSYGHRFHHPGPVEISDPNHYESALFAAKVVVDFQQRQTQIREQILHLANAAQLEAVIPDDLLEEVTSIVEWPCALVANFDAKFLEVPAEALMAAMQIHQKSFALYTPAGKIAPHFIAVANIESQNVQQIKQGNEKVMRARLSDADFFFQKDQQQGLASHLPALKQVVFQTQLGSLADKSQRIADIMTKLQTPLHLDHAELMRSATLCKCDLLTGMVGEFPELQGIMGYYYATYAYESAAVALALKEQYLPRFAQDELPTSALGHALSLADRLDTLYGLFAIGQKPTGVKDPFKLRRHALAIARMLSILPGMSLQACLHAAGDAYIGHLTDKSAELIPELKLFLLERLQGYYQNQEVPTEVFQAVRACQADDLYDLAQRISALQNFIQDPQAQALTAMAKRVNNVLAQVAKTTEPTVNPALFSETAEQHLWAEIEKIDAIFKQNPKSYGDNLLCLVKIEPVLADFFAKVMVMVEDPNLQQNRVSLLRRLQCLLTSIADLSHLAALIKSG